MTSGCLPTSTSTAPPTRPPGPSVEEPTTELTSLLLAWRAGDPGALERLVPRVYSELRRIAGHLVRRERREHTHNATALVHEAYLRLVDLERIDWRDRVHFFAMASRIMRRVLVEHARAQGRRKRGGGARRIDLGDAGPDALGGDRDPELLALDQALRELARLDAERARVVELRYFGGLDREQIAAALGISSATVTRRWRSARAWLIDYLGAPAPCPTPTGA